tara:strand:- start:101 stop:1510 length:1410 start_codon:yes stop_codon:yes gene_type:complete
MGDIAARNGRGMGLSGGPKGAKAVFQERFGGAFATLQTLKSVREVSGLPREAALAVLDGNVMMSGIPTSIDTFAGYVGVLSSQIRAAHEAAAHVVVVFDEPAAMTMAKRDEQRRRDAQRRPKKVVCSEELVEGITDDNYTTAMLSADGFNAKTLMNHRPARARYFDAVCLALLRGFAARGAHRNGSLTFDGVDRRGAEREWGAPRVAGVLSTHQEFWGALLAREAPIGEGDLKLTDVTQRVHDAAQVPGGLVAGVVLNLVVTIDTDSFAIELLQQDRRLRRDDGHRGDDERTIVCFKERSRKRQGDDFPTPGQYLCCDMHVFHEAVAEYFYGTLSLSREIVQQQPAAMALLAAALACCGCDFVEVKGMRVDLVLPIVRDIVRNHREHLGAMAHVFAAERATVLRAASALEFLISEFADAVSDMPRMQKAHASASGACRAQVMRALWTCSYWHQKEYTDCIDWGFASTSG